MAFESMQNEGKHLIFKTKNCVPLNLNKEVDHIMY